jgi:D-2-hydroxyacid dehydrogenase (NADP+)
MTKVLILDNFAEEYRAALAAEFPTLDLHVAHGKDELAGDLSAFDVLVAFGIAIDDDLMLRLSGLRWIQSLATGVDHFLRSPGLRKETLLTSARGIHGPAMSETVAFLMLSVTHEAATLIANQAARVWQRRTWRLLHGKTALVCGVGLSSTAVGRLLQAFGMRVIGASRTPRTVEGFDEIVPTDALAAHVGRADYLINVLPAAPENSDIIGASVFAAMKPTSYFINVGRGETVDENALIAALRDRRIAGAGLDVFRHEPLPADNPLWSMPNVLVTPHVAGFFKEYEEFVLPLIRRNMKRFLAGDVGRMENVIAH